MFFHNLKFLSLSVCMCVCSHVCMVKSNVELFDPYMVILYFRRQHVLDFKFGISVIFCKFCHSLFYTSSYRVCNSKTIT